MKFAVQLYSVRDHIENGNDMLEILGKVKEIGFDGVEFAGYFGLDAGVLRARCEELGLEVVGSHLGLDDYKPENLDKTLAYGKALGAKYLGVGGAPHSTYEEAKNTGDVLSAAGVKAIGLDWVVLENDDPVPTGLEDITRSYKWLQENFK